MFNNAKFQNSKFNTEKTNYIGFYVTLSAGSSIKANEIISIVESVTLKANSRIIRTIKADAKLKGKSSITADARLYRIHEVLITEEFKPGDIIILNSNTFELTKNNQNIIDTMQGDFFYLQKKNTVIYSDNENMREIDMEINYRDRWL